MARISRSDITTPHRYAEHPTATATPAASAHSHAPVDHVHAKTGGTDGKAFVTAQLADVRARVARGEKVRVAFDIDDTLADSRVRTLHLAKAWDKDNGTHYFDRLTLAQVAHNGLDTAKAMGLPGKAEQAFEQHWNTAFWDSKNFTLDGPMPETVALVKAFEAAGAQVVYLSGRTKNLEGASIGQLERFGLKATHRNVITKPDMSVRTVPFKTEWLKKSAQDGYHMAFFFTESRRDVAGIQSAFPSCANVLLDSPFGGTDGISSDTPIYPRAK